MTKNLKQTVLSAAVAVGCLSAAVSAHAAEGLQWIFPTAPWGDWGAIVQSDFSFLGHKVRGQLSRRQARERIFYNTTSNTGPYDRFLHVECEGQAIQENYNWGNAAQGGFGNYFFSDSDADLTLFCQSGHELVNDGANSYAWINSR